MQLTLGDTPEARSNRCSGRRSLLVARGWDDPAMLSPRIPSEGPRWNVDAVKTEDQRIALPNLAG
jgi:hypothetical protein